MSKDSFIHNLYRAASKMISQFSTEEPLISDETKKMLDDTDTRKEMLEKIISKPIQGEVTVNHKGEEVIYFVEA